MNSICRLKQTRGNTYSSDGLLALVLKQSQSRAFANKTIVEQNELIRASLRKRNVFMSFVSFNRQNSCALNRPQADGSVLSNKTAQISLGNYFLLKKCEFIWL
jgi:hypothetical protein